MYFPLPPDMEPEEPTATADPEKPTVDTSWLAIVTHWRYVAVDLITLHGVDLWDPAVRARPWPGVRNLIFSLLEPDSPSRLRRALTRR